jgi:sarcosine oxidase
MDGRRGPRQSPSRATRGSRDAARRLRPSPHARRHRPRVGPGAGGTPPNSSPSPRRYDVIVVGVGGMGSATVYHLARRGVRVLGIERFDVPHELGSSHGHTRIIRLAYYEHPSYVMLLHRAYQLWRELQRHVGEQLLHITGSIDAGPADSWVFKGSLQSCIDYELEHEVLTGAEIHERFPGYRLPHNTLAVLQPDGGFLVPERCIVSHVVAAQNLGAEVHGREAVLGWDAIGDGVRVTTDRDVYEADRLVVVAGPWTYELIDELRGLAVPERQVLAWLQPYRAEVFRPDTFPVFNVLVEQGRYYGFPVFGVPGFKFGKYHHFEEIGDPDLVDREPHPYDEGVLREFAERYFPDGAGPTMSLKACLFTNSPDKHFIIDTHPTYPQVSFAAGFSGHGFKFASVIGETMADLAQRGYSRHDIELFNLDRFGGRLPRGDRIRRQLAEPLGSATGSAAIPRHRAGRQPSWRSSQPHMGLDRGRLHAAYGNRRGWAADDTGLIADWDPHAIKPFW